MATRGRFSNSFNHLLYKSHATRYMFHTHSLSSLINIVTVVNKPGDSMLEIRAFARSLLHDRNVSHFLSLEDFNDILNVICTE